MDVSDYSPPGGMYPQYDEDVVNDALFHYTTAAGLLGILRNQTLWCTAHYCTNDQTELRQGREILTPIFRKKMRELTEEKDKRVLTFRGRGVDPFSYANSFEGTILSAALSYLSVYIACFCKPNGKEDFLHGLLSQWRGYGADGGYAIQFSRKKLSDTIKKTNAEREIGYRLQDIEYEKENELKNEVLALSGEFEQAFLKHLEWLVNLDFKDMTAQDMAGGLSTQALVSVLDYLAHTKSHHFREESECRLSVLGTNRKEDLEDYDYFNRNGLIVPFIPTVQELDICSCIEGVIVGPAPRINSRTESVRHLIRKQGLRIPVRPSQIPFTRL